MTRTIRSLLWDPLPAKGLVVISLGVFLLASVLTVRLWNLTREPSVGQITLPCRLLGRQRWILDRDGDLWRLRGPNGKAVTVPPGEPFPAGNVLLRLNAKGRLVHEGFRFSSADLSRPVTVGWSRSSDIIIDHPSVPLKAGLLAFESQRFYFNGTDLRDGQALTMGDVSLTVQLADQEVRLVFLRGRPSGRLWQLKSRNILSGPVADLDIAMDQELIDWQFLEEVKSLCERGLLIVSNGQVTVGASANASWRYMRRLRRLAARENLTPGLTLFRTDRAGKLVGLRQTTVKISNPYAGLRRPVRGAILDRHRRQLAFSKLVNGRQVRTWPAGPATAQIVGLQATGLAATGLERVGERRLAQGQDVVTTLDLEYQKIVFQELRQAIDAIAEARGRGAAVMMDARSGALRAVVSLPAFDPNSGPSRAAARNGPNDGPMFNRPLSGLYTPGSTFKIITAAALLESQVESFDVVCDPQGTKIEGRRAPFYCWAAKYGGHGRLSDEDLDRAFMLSCNTFFLNVPLVLGRTDNPRFHDPAAFLKWPQRFGLSPWPSGDQQTSTISGLPVQYGRFPSAAKWAADPHHWNYNDADLAALGFGQGELVVSPLAVARWTAVVASGGLLPVPHLLPGRQEADNPQRVISRRTAARLKEMMCLVVETMQQDGQVYRGTGRAAFAGLDLPFRVAAKTGTAEVGGDRPPHAWFTSFAPAENPRIVLTVLIEHGGHGNGPTAEVAGRILKRIAGRIQ